MDSINAAADILSDYEEIESVQIVNDRVITFGIATRRYVLICPMDDDITSEANILVFAEDIKVLPHYSVFTYRDTDIKDKNIKLLEGKYRSICLYEHEDVIFSLLTYEEKIRDSVERLLEFLNMTESQMKKEFQKEFMHYWNECAEDGVVDVYIGDEISFSRLNVYQSEYGIRCVKAGVFLADKDKMYNNAKMWKHRPDIDAFVIPISDPRDIMPPIKKGDWSKKNIVEIVYSTIISHISHETYEEVRKERRRRDLVIIFWNMQVEGMDITFATELQFFGQKKGDMINELINGDYSVVLLKCDRMDFKYLNGVIGNETNNESQNVMLIGAGSLGSYVCAELAKNGYKYLTICDGDKLEKENIMRWAYGGFGQKLNKAEALKMLMEMIHPEIRAEAVSKDINSENINDYLEKCDLIIFTIGSSDTQLSINRTLKEKGYKGTALFSWIEAGGEFSHILKVDYGCRGCFECLYTSADGKLINNTVNNLPEAQSSERMLRNGCGGTRAPYGTAVLLRTTSVMLEMIKNTNAGILRGTVLADISVNGVEYKENIAASGCKCCGN